MEGNETSGYIVIPTSQDDIASGMAQDNGSAQNRTKLSIESLLRLGCLEKSTKGPIESSRTAYGVLEEAISVTVTGVNFYCAASGEKIENFLPTLNADEIRRRSGVSDEMLIRRGSDNRQ